VLQATDADHCEWIKPRVVLVARMRLDGVQLD